MATTSTGDPPLPPFAPERAIQKARVGEGPTGSINPTDHWPALPLEQWKDACATGHRLTETGDKIGLALTPFMNHWWNVPLCINACALTTSPIPYCNHPFELGFDPLVQEPALQRRDPVPELFPLKPMSAVDSYHEVLHRLRSSGIEVRTWRVPVRVPDPIPCDEDRVHTASNPESGQTFSKIRLSASTA